MKILMMVLMVGFVGCGSNSDNTYHCSDDSEFAFYDYGNYSGYEFSVNTCNSIASFIAYNQDYIDRNNISQSLIVITKNVQAVESENKQVQIHYEEGYLWFSAKGAIINGFAKSYLYTYNYDDEYITKDDRSGGELYIYSYTDLYKSIIFDVLHENTLVEANKITGH
jgi:hypothetical protein